MLQIKNGEIFINPTKKYKVEDVVINKTNPSEKNPEFDKHGKSEVECTLVATNKGEFDVETGLLHKSFQLVDLSRDKRCALLEVEVISWDKKIELKFKLIFNKTDSFNLP